MDNIYIKMQSMKVLFQKMNVKKTGENKFVGYKYYDLGDIMPPINDLMLQHKCLSQVSFTRDLATLTVINAENPEERLEFTSPMEEATLKGAHPVQNLGAVETYQRRYLYMTAFDIVEADVLDMSQGKDDKKPEPPKKKKVTLPPDVAEGLNAKMKAYMNISKIDAKQCAELVREAIGKPLADVTVKDAETIMKTLDGWIAGAEGVVI